MSNVENERCISIVIGRTFSMYGVKDIRGFDEESVSLDTSWGKICVEGEGLKIESLSKEDGRIFINGDIKGVFCEPEITNKPGLIKRIFSK